MPPRPWNRIATVLLSLCLLSACAQATSPSALWVAPAKDEPAPTGTATNPPRSQASLFIATPTGPPTPTQTSESIQPSPGIFPTQAPHTNPKYKLSVELDYATHNLVVEEHVEYTNNLAEPLDDLALMVAPLLYSDVFLWQRLSWGDGTPILEYDLYPGYLIIPLDKPLGVGERISLWIEYELQLPHLDPEAAFRQHGPLGYTELQANLADWYPFIPPYRPGVGWLSHPPGSYGEHLVYEMADFEVTIQPVGKLSDLVIAASGQENIENDAYHYQIRNARNFTWSASPYYRMKSSVVGDTTVNSYYFSEHWIAGQSVLTTTVGALDLFSQLFAPYPHSTITAVEADFVDGMEYDGLYFLGKDYYAIHNKRTADFLITIAAHETAHQWWYGLVGNDQALEPWLDEALSTYSEYLFYEHLHPDDLEWWWTYRLMAYQPQGSIDIAIYDVQGTNRYREYRDAVYLNGAVFLHDLRKIIGDQSFFDFLQSYLGTHQHSLSTTDGFFSVLRTHTSSDLSPLIEKYFSLDPILDEE